METRCPSVSLAPQEFSLTPSISCSLDSGQAEVFLVPLGRFHFVPFSGKSIEHSINVKWCPCDNSGMLQPDGPSDAKS